MRTLLGLGVLFLLNSFCLVKASDPVVSESKPMTTQQISEALLDPKLFVFIGDQKTKKAFILSPRAIYQWGKYEKFRIPNEVGARCNLLTWNEFQKFMGQRLAIYVSDSSGVSSGRRVSYITNQTKWEAFIKENKDRLIVVLDVHSQEPTDNFYIKKS